MRSSSRSGFTLTELIVVMGVMSAIIGAIWYAAGNTREAQKESDALAEMQAVVRNTYDLFQGRTISTGNLTGALITANAIPTIYVNASSSTKANTPWSPQNFFVYGQTSRTFRVTFYNVSHQGCMALLMQGTACQSGTAYCPTAVSTGGTVGGSTSTSNSPSCVAGNCNGTVNAAMGWQVLTSSNVQTLCSTTYNSYTGGSKNSVEFDYAL